MITKAFCFYDSKVGVYYPPFFFPHDALALRAAHDLSKDTGTHIGRHPEDFILFYVGFFDDQTGILGGAGADMKNFGTVAAIAAQAERQGELKL